LGYLPAKKAARLQPAESLGSFVTGFAGGPNTKEIPQEAVWAAAPVLVVSHAVALQQKIVVANVMFLAS
jgi:hypothetical protein